MGQPVMSSKKRLILEFLLFLFALSVAVVIAVKKGQSERLNMQVCLVFFACKCWAHSRFSSVPSASKKAVEQ